jgi:hypothetical protein
MGGDAAGADSTADGSGPCGPRIVGAPPFEPVRGLSADTRVDRPEENFGGPAARSSGLRQVACGLDVPYFLVQKVLYLNSLREVNINRADIRLPEGPCSRCQHLTSVSTVS